MVKDTKEHLVKTGERLDQIIFTHYNIEPSELNEALDFVYASNPNLAAIKQPFKLALNDVLYVVLPPLPEKQPKGGINLWD